MHRRQAGFVCAEGGVVLLLVCVLAGCRDCFLTRDEFSQLLFAACTPWKPGEVDLAFFAGCAAGIVWC
jgi:hypothetical protein